MIAARDTVLHGLLDTHVGLSAVRGESLFWFNREQGLFSLAAGATPLDSAATNKKMAAASCCSPDGWRHRERPVSVRSKPPEGAGIWQ